MNPRDDFILYKNENMTDNIFLSEKSKRRMQGSKSYNTLKSYSADWNDFADWCEVHGCKTLPCTPETIVNYINDLADNARANTVGRRVTAISENHIAAGFGNANPAKDSMVAITMQAIRREKGTFQKGKAPILMETITLLSDLFDHIEKDLTAIRDKAMLFVGFAGAFRRSELVAIQMEHLQFTPNGLVIFIPQSKADQLGHGSTIAIPYAPDKSQCAVSALEEWLGASQIKEGPIFRSINKAKHIGQTKLSDKTVALVVKKYMAMLGMDAKDFSGHSLRRGFATSAAQHDLGALAIMRQTRHKSEKMVHRYIEQGEIFKENPLNHMYKK